MKKENKKIITLKAVLITIIVLLILVVVNLLLILRNDVDNSMIDEFSQSIKYGKVDREAQAALEIERAWESARTKYLEDWVVDTSKKIDDYVTKAKLDTYLKDNGYLGHLEGEPKFDENEKAYEVNYRTNEPNELYTFLVSEDGKVEKKTGVILDKAVLSLEPTETATLNAQLVELEGPIIWESKNTEVATVSNGVVTAIASGETIIEAICGEKSATCEVIVVSK